MIAHTIGTSRQRLETRKTSRLSLSLSLELCVQTPQGLYFPTRSECLFHCDRWLDCFSSKLSDRQFLQNLKHPERVSNKYKCLQECPVLSARSLEQTNGSSMIGSQKLINFAAMLVLLSQHHRFSKMKPSFSRMM